MLKSSSLPASFFTLGLYLIIIPILDEHVSKCYRYMLPQQQTVKGVIYCKEEP